MPDEQSIWYHANQIAKGLAIFAMGTTGFYWLRSLLSNQSSGDQPSRPDIAVAEKTNDALFPSTLSLADTTELLYEASGQTTASLAYYNNDLMLITSNTSSIALSLFSENDLITTIVSHDVKPAYTPTYSGAYSPSAAEQLLMFTNSQTSMLEYQRIKSQSGIPLEFDGSPQPLNVTNTIQHAAFRTTFELTHNSGGIVVGRSQPTDHYEIIPFIYQTYGIFDTLGPATSLLPNQTRPNLFVMDNRNTPSQKKIILASDSHTGSAEIDYWIADSSGVNTVAKTYPSDGYNIVAQASPFLNDQRHVSAYTMIDTNSVNTLRADIFTIDGTNTVHVNHTATLPFSQTYPPSDRPAALYHTHAGKYIVISVRETTVNGKYLPAINFLSISDQNAPPDLTTTSRSLLLNEPTDILVTDITDDPYHNTNFNSVFFSAITNENGQSIARLYKTYLYSQNALPGTTKAKQNEKFYPLKNYDAVGATISMHIEISADKKKLIDSIDYPDNPQCTFLEKDVLTLWAYASKVSDLISCMRDVSATLKDSSEDFTLTVNALTNDIVFQSTSTKITVSLPDSDVDPLTIAHYVATAISTTSVVLGGLWRLRTIKNLKEPFFYGTTPEEKLAFLLGLSRREPMRSGGGQALTAALTELVMIIKDIIDKNTHFDYVLDDDFTATTIIPETRLQAIRNTEAPSLVNKYYPLVRMQDDAPAATDRLVAAIAVTLNTLNAKATKTKHKLWGMYQLVTAGDAKSALSEMANLIPKDANQKYNLGKELFILATSQNNPQLDQAVRNLKLAEERRAKDSKAVFSITTLLKQEAKNKSSNKSRWRFWQRNRDPSTYQRLLEADALDSSLDVDLEQTL